MMIECEAPATLNRTGAAEFAGRKGATNNRAPPGPRSTKPSPTLTDKTRAKDVTAAQPCVRAAEFRRGWGVMVGEAEEKEEILLTQIVPANSFKAPLLIVATLATGMTGCSAVSRAGSSART